MVVKGTSVVVRRPRGRGRSEVHLDPRYRWSVRVGGATSHTRLLLSGLHLDDLKIDSGATRIDVVLPRPEGVVPVDISSGVTGVRLHRPRGTAALAQVSAGALRLRLDGASTLAVLADDRWTSDDSAAGDRYELRVNSGTGRRAARPAGARRPAGVRDGRGAGGDRPRRRSTRWPRSSSCSTASKPGSGSGSGPADRRTYPRVVTTRDSRCPARSPRRDPRLVRDDRPRARFRQTSDPYAVLVSELMAQQTQAARAAEAWTALDGALAHRRGAGGRARSPTSCGRGPASATTGGP